MSRRTFFVGFALVAVLLAGVVSYFASAAPDGLTKVAEEHGIAAAEQEHATSGSPFAGYSAEWLDNGLLSGGLAGVVGVAVVLLLAGGLGRVLRRKADRG